MSPLITAASAVINEIDKVNTAQKNNKIKKEYKWFDLDKTLSDIKHNTKINTSAWLLLDWMNKDNSDPNKVHVNLSNYWTKLDNATKWISEYSPYTEKWIMLWWKEYTKMHNSLWEYYADDDLNLISPSFIEWELKKEVNGLIDHEAINKLYDEILKW